jgi:hypothetical protein
VFSICKTVVTKMAESRSSFVKVALETHLSKHSSQGLSEYLKKYSGLQTLALLSIHSAYILI